MYIHAFKRVIPRWSSKNLATLNLYRHNSYYKTHEQLYQLTRISEWKLKIFNVFGLNDMTHSMLSKRVLIAQIFINMRRTTLFLVFQWFLTARCVLIFKDKFIQYTAHPSRDLSPWTGNIKSRKAVEKNMFVSTARTKYDIFFQGIPFRSNTAGKRKIIFLFFNL